MAAVQIGQLNSDAGRIAVLNEGPGSKIIASNQCGDFPFKLMKMTDPRVDVDSIADYDKNVIAYVGARTWNKFKYDKEYTNPSQLKFSNIKTPGPEYLVDMKWWLDYKVKITFKDFPWPVDVSNGKIDAHGFMGKNNVFCLRPYPLHQCTDNIHLRLNNRDMTSYPIQMLNQRMEYWNQERLKESCGFCPHRKPVAQTTWSENTGRSPFMNIGSTYDGDYGNEVVLGEVTIENFDSAANKTETDQYTYNITTSKTATTYHPMKKCNGSVTFSMREPVMVEPLDYYSSKNGSKTMNNITSIDLEYNFNNLRNMILFNQRKLYSLSKEKAPKKDLTEISKGETNWMNIYIEKNLDSIINVSIEEAWLIIDVATPHMPPSMPFVTDYVEYRRYETTAKEFVKKDVIKSDRNKIYEIESDIYSMNYMPNAIYIWVAPNDALVYGSGYRCFYNNTYAQLTGVEIDYGNLTKLCHKYDEKDLYLMALRNGLEDRTYADWTRTNKVFYHALPDYSSDTDYYTNIDRNEFFGVGSVLRMIPGIDIVSGGEQTLIGGMKITNETIKFHVKYRPLNITEPEIKYSLFVAFEYNGICTITPNFCDLAMIHIDSYNQIANAERAPRYRISRIYGKGLWDKTKKFFGKVNNFAKKSKIVSRTLGMIPHPIAKAGAKALDSLGYGYGGSRSTRMRGGMVIPPGSFYRTY